MNALISLMLLALIGIGARYVIQAVLRLWAYALVALLVLGLLVAAAG